MSSAAKSLAKLVSVELVALVELDEGVELEVVPLLELVLPFTAFSSWLRVIEPLLSSPTLLITWLAIWDAEGGCGGPWGAELCSALASSLELSSPSPLVSSFANSLAMAELSVEDDDELAEDVLEEVASTAVSSCDRLSSPFPPGLMSLINWLANWSNGDVLDEVVELSVVAEAVEVEAPAPVVVDALESFSWAESREASVSPLN